MKKVLLLLISLLFLSCANRAPSSSVKHHMQSSHKLQILLNDLNNVVFERLYTELERDELRIGYAKELSKEIDILIRILSSQKDFLKDSEKRNQRSSDYLTILDQLQQNNQELKIMVENFKPEKIQPFITNSINLCNTCHTKLRDTH